MHFIFQHGWGFSDSCWRGWRKLLPPSATHFLGNRGYWGPARPLTDQQPPPGSVLVCHSLGLQLLPPSLIQGARLLVIVSGFVHFHGATLEDARFTRRHLNRLRLRLQSNPLALIRDFHRDCGVTKEPLPEKEAIDTELLTRDLDLLDQGRLEPRPPAAWPVTLILHGQDDRIVRPQRATELAAFIPGSRLITIDKAGHGLPFTHQKTCLDLTLALLRQIDPSA